MKKRYIGKLLAIVFFLTVLIAIFEITGLRQHLDIEFLRRIIQENLFFGLVSFVMLFALGNLVQIPGWIFLAAAVITLGKLSGGTATYVAAVFSCTITYGIIQYLGQDALRDMDGALARKLFERLDSHPISSVVLLRIVFQTVPILNYTLALSGIKFRHYFIGTVLGLPVPIFFYCLFFDFLSQNLFGLTVP